MSDAKIDPTLKLCPWCGEEAEMVTRSRHDYYVQCTMTCAPAHTTHTTKAAAAAAWNLRAPDPDVERLVEAAAAICDPNNTVDETYSRMKALRDALAALDCETPQQSTRGETPTAVEALEKAHAAGGNAWDEIDDPEQYLREHVRGTHCPECHAEYAQVCKCVETPLIDAARKEAGRG